MFPTTTMPHLPASRRLRLAGMKAQAAEPDLARRLRAGVLI
jgi:hypothetical protein